MKMYVPPSALTLEIPVFCSEYAYVFRVSHNKQ
jgi:hypothetical protein